MTPSISTEAGIIVKGVLVSPPQAGGSINAPHARNRAVAAQCLNLTPPRKTPAQDPLYRKLSWPRTPRPKRIAAARRPRAPVFRKEGFELFRFALRGDRLHGR